MTKECFRDDQTTPVVLVHGLFMTQAFWAADNYKPLSEKYPVYTISLPGHYPEPAFKPGESLTKDSVLACFDRQLDKVAGDKPVVLIGHSTGGMMALFYASQRPQRVSKVISVGGTENGEEEALTYRFFQYASAHWGRVGMALVPPSLWLSSATAALHRYFLKEAFAHPEQLLRDKQIRSMIDGYLPDLHKLDRKTLSVMLNDLQYFDVAEELKTIKIPSLIICGDQDCYVSRDRTYQLGDLVPQAQVHIFADCGHLCMWEKPEMFYGLVLKFIAAAPGKGDARQGSRREKLAS